MSPADRYWWEGKRCVASVQDDNKEVVLVISPRCFLLAHELRQFDHLWLIKFLTWIITGCYLSLVLLRAWSRSLDSCFLALRCISESVCPMIFRAFVAGHASVFLLCIGIESLVISGEAWLLHLLVDSCRTISFDSNPSQDWGGLKSRHPIDVLEYLRLPLSKVV